MKRLIGAILICGLTVFAVTGPTVSADSSPSLPIVPAVSGSVYYGNPHPSSIRPVADVNLLAQGIPSLSTRTGPDRTPSWGQYSLSGFGPSPYFIIPHKSGTTNNFINSFDAAKIARHVAGLELLDDTQRLVADVTGNGNINSYDAAKIAAYVVNSPYSQSSTGEWIFDPADRSYQSITSDIPYQDYTAFLMGEVSGNWNNNGNGGGGTRPTNNGSVSVSIADVQVRAGNEAIVPVFIRGARNRGIISYEFDLRYDPNVILPLANPVNVAGTVSRGLSFAVNSSEPGLLRVAVYGPMPIEKNGVLLNLKFMAVGSAGSVSPLRWERFMVNEDDVAAGNGQVKLSSLSE